MLTRLQRTYSVKVHSSLLIVEVMKNKAEYKEHVFIAFAFEITHTYIPCVQNSYKYNTNIEKLCKLLL